MVHSADRDLVRGMTEEEVPLVERLLEQCNSFEGLDLPVPIEPDRGRSTEMGPVSNFLVYHDGVLIGFACLPEDPDEPEACGMVHPEHRRRGYGRQMLMDTVDMLLREGWERIIIEVATENRNALGLYESCGFRATRTYSYYQFAAKTE